MRVTLYETAVAAHKQLSAFLRVRESVVAAACGGVDLANKIKKDFEK